MNDKVKEIIEFNNEVDELINERIERIKSKLNSLNFQLLTMETILKDIKSKIDALSSTPDSKTKYVEKSRLLRWYLEDIKIYNELNSIYQSYEKLLNDYISQKVSNRYKFEELEIKKSKIDTDSSSIEDVMKEFIKKYEEINPIKLPSKNVEDEDDIYSL